MIPPSPLKTQRNRKSLLDKPSLPHCSKGGVRQHRHDACRPYTRRERVVVTWWWDVVAVMAVRRESEAHVVEKKIFRAEPALDVTACRDV